ncbi:MAG TPA: glutamate--tRNA ligase family protein, partial [Puia sp.]|nr:glutamate--tRNA ligase family protein [Puia sp.]
PSPQYDHSLRMDMRNSLSLTLEETERLLEDETAYVIRIMVPEHETVSFTDMIRGEVSFNTSTLDDKVLLKADGMPTYHLAVVVDDFLMKISHAFRGEEWLPSAPIHILLWRYLFDEENMPQWAHFPLILKPDGNGKLSKRDGDRLGFPVFAMDWNDPASGELYKGFKERGFLPEAFINMLAVMGWNDGSEKEIYSLAELVQGFSIDRVHKSGAKFDYEKAKWFNHEWIRQMTVDSLQLTVSKIFEERGIEITDEVKLGKVIALVKDRCTLLPDFYDEGKFFFEAPARWDLEAVKPKWTAEKNQFFIDFAGQFSAVPQWDAPGIETNFKALAAAKNLKPGELQLPFRIMLVGEKKGPPVFEIAASLGKEETMHRMSAMLAALNG